MYASIKLLYAVMAHCYTDIYMHELDLQTGVELTIRVTDADPAGNADDLVDSFRIWLGGSPPVNVADRVYIGGYHNGRLGLGYRVWCNRGWQGSRCDQRKC